ncbi:MAG: hypothetical protein ACHQRJ_19130 [Alphaproteobacteria bacterium]
MPAIASAPLTTTLPDGDGLAALTLDAAIELDQLLQRRSDKKEAVLNLSQKLKTTPGLTGGPESLKSLADPITIEIFSRALRKHSGEPIASYKDLASKIRELTSDIDKLLANTGQPHIQQLLKFCIDLHHEIIQHRRICIDMYRHQSKYRA